MYVSNGFDAAGLKKEVHLFIFFKSTSQYVNENIKQHIAAL
jgi:hypothetical protein